MSKALYNIDIDDLKLVRKGKVREVFDMGESLLIVATDRISAFDVIMNGLMFYHIGSEGTKITPHHHIIDPFFCLLYYLLVGNHFMQDICNGKTNSIYC